MREGVRTHAFPLKAGVINIGRFSCIRSFLVKSERISFRVPRARQRPVVYRATVLHRNNVRSRRRYSSSWFFALLFQFPRTSVAHAARATHNVAKSAIRDENTNQNSITPSFPPTRGCLRRALIISIAESSTEALLFAGQIIARAPIGRSARRAGFMASARAIASPHCGAGSCRVSRISSHKKIIARPSSWPYLNASAPIIYHPVRRGHLNAPRTEVQRPELKDKVRKLTRIENV